MEKKLIVIVGPTGVGKTELTLRIAEHLATPIINSDSRQIFKEIPIGTAAPTKEQQKRVKHYFVGNHSIDDYYSASMFESDVMNLLTNKLFIDSHIALMSGGSMMYIDAVCNGIDDIPTIDDQTRTLMKQRLENEGLERLLEELKMLDPEHWAIVDKKNYRRRTSDRHPEHGHLIFQRAGAVERQCVRCGSDGGLWCLYEDRWI